MESIYNELINAGVAVDNHESDLYAEVNEKSREIVSRYEHKENVTMFKNQVTGTMWYDIPFAFSPFWDKKLKNVK